jgi:HupE / UreJ protein
MRVVRDWLMFLVLELAISASAPAHSMNQAAILLDFRDNAVNAEIQLPADRLQAALRFRESISEYVLSGLSASLPNGRKFAIALTGSPYRTLVEGAPYTILHVRMTPPAGAGADLFDLSSSVLTDRVPSQVVLVSVRADWRASTFATEPQLAGVLRGADRTVRLDRRTGSWWSGFASVFRLGMRHIAEGTDHLLFLLTLMLPAPLLVARGRWSGYTDVRRCLLRIAQVVSAFTAGHSVTLALGALNLVHLANRPIEATIALSILLSAVHAFRPLFPGREAAIAGGFGLVHGMAFASTLAELGLGGWERVASIFGFNLGIETMQLIVVAAALPSLILLSRTRIYSSIRIAGALFAGTAAAAWVVQRLWDLPNPADPLVTALAQHAGWIVSGLTLLGLFARTSSAFRREGGLPAQ